MSQFTHRHRVAFHETDAAGIVHFSNFFRVVESAEHAFWRSLGMSVHQEIDGQRIAWPRVAAACDYKAPLRFEDEVDVTVAIEERKPKSLRWGFKLALPDGSPIATATLTTVCVRRAEDGSMRAIEIPASIVEALEQYRS